MTYKEHHPNWSRKSKNEIDQIIELALEENINYRDSLVMGIPATHLDKQEFTHDAQLLDGSTFLKTLINNPNHIGIHTNMKQSEPYFSGTQKLEAQVIRIVSEDILLASPNSIDGYISSGGTEGNIQALWVYRNYFNDVYSLDQNYSSIAIVCSEDTHYSCDKASNLLNLKIVKIRVHEDTRAIDQNHLEEQLKRLRKKGISNLIVVCNMMTTMFGSVDNLDTYFDAINLFNYFKTKVHVDGAYGGFLHPFTKPDQPLTFKDSRISSFALDAHKMLQAPYGTGIFVITKGLLKYTLTNSAQYVTGKDCTLIGSRSGANAISIFKILHNYGPIGWAEKVTRLVSRAETLKNELNRLGVRLIYFEGSNIITIHSSEMTTSLALKYGLVPDNHLKPNWYKIVVMDHVKAYKIQKFLKDFKLFKSQKYLKKDFTKSKSYRLGISPE